MVKRTAHWLNFLIIVWLTSGTINNGSKMNRRLLWLVKRSKPSSHDAMQCILSMVSMTLYDSFWNVDHCDCVSVNHPERDEKHSCSFSWCVRCIHESESELIYKPSDYRYRSHRNTDVWCGRSVPVFHVHTVLHCMYGKRYRRQRPIQHYPMIYFEGIFCSSCSISCNRPLVFSTEVVWISKTRGSSCRATE